MNNSVVASPRALIAVLENFVGKDGSVVVPGVLVSYMGGLGKVEKGEGKFLAANFTNLHEYFFGSGEVFCL